MAEIAGEVTEGARAGTQTNLDLVTCALQDLRRFLLGLGTGPGAFSYLTSDLGHGYVDVNADYRS